MKTEVKQYSENSTTTHMEREEFLRRIQYIRGHLEAVGRMVEQDRDGREVLRQVRAVRRAAEKLEIQCLLSELTVNGGVGRIEDVRKVVELYRLSNR